MINIIQHRLLPEAVNSYRHLRATRQAFEEDSDARRERTAVETLLKEAVKKYVRIETEREGRHFICDS